MHQNFNYCCYNKLINYELIVERDNKIFKKPQCFNQTKNFINIKGVNNGKR